MPFATTKDGVKLYFEETGKGVPLLFIHEFGGDHRDWEPQMQYFGSIYRCISYSARGYPPSDVPTELADYSQELAVADAVAVLDHLKIKSAHIIGLSMGGFTAVHMGLQYPERCYSLCVAGCGYGAEKKYEEYFKGVSLEVAKNFEEKGASEFAKIYSLGASRVQFQNKNPRGWQEFAQRLAEHSSKGSALTMRGVQARRPSLYDLEEELKSMSVPTLIVNGDEDDHCLQVGLYLKKVIPASGLLVLPKTGHTLNLEDPGVFNSSISDFLTLVSNERWLPRDPRANPEQVMRTD